MNTCVYVCTHACTHTHTHIFCFPLSTSLPQTPFKNIDCHFWWWPVCWVTYLIINLGGTVQVLLLKPHRGYQFPTQQYGTWMKRKKKRKICSFCSKWNKRPRVRALLAWYWNGTNQVVGAGCCRAHGRDSLQAWHVRENRALLLQAQRLPS